jgi:hypothetical protein
MKERLLDLFGLLLVGDGVLTLLDPKRHCLLWEVGPKGCREMIDGFVEHPQVTRCLAVAEVLAGALVAQMQKPGLLDSMRR